MALGFQSSAFQNNAFQGGEGTNNAYRLWGSRLRGAERRRHRTERDQKDIAQFMETLQSRLDTRFIVNRHLFFYAFRWMVNGTLVRLHIKILVINPFERRFLE